MGKCVLANCLMGAYAGLWRVVRPLLRRHKRLGDGFAMRLVPEDWAPCVDVWVQAASGGEAYLAWEILKAIKCEDTGFAPSETSNALRFLLTSCTRQGYDTLQEAAQWAAVHRPELSITVQFFPLDEPCLMHRALEQARPRLVVLLETELWPSLLRACRQYAVPTMVLNGRMSTKSFGAYFLMRRFWQSMGPSFVAAIAEDDAKRFSLLFGVQSHVMQNIKFDRLGFTPSLYNEAPTHTADPVQARVERIVRHYGPMALLGSVREEEEPALVSAVAMLWERLEERVQKHQEDTGSIEQAPVIIVAPRHMHRVAAWQKSLEQRGLPVLLRSRLDKDDVALGKDAVVPQKKTSIILWDSFGELDALYACARAVFVGGSLEPLGGQNFLEPLAKGTIPSVGPYVQNFAWLDPASLEDAGLLHTVSSKEELVERLYKDMLTSKNMLVLGDRLTPREAKLEVQERFGHWLESRRGGAAQAVDFMRRFVSV